MISSKKVVTVVTVYFVIAASCAFRLLLLNKKLTLSSWTLFDKIDSFSNESLPLKEKSLLPHFVIHVGPPKTASTTLQEYLSQWTYEGIFQKHDQYVYIGRFVAGKGKIPASARKLLKTLKLSLYNLDCHAMMSTIRQQYYEERNKRLDLQQNFINMTLSEAILSNVSCARDIIANLKPYALNQTNLLYLEEGLSVRDMKNYGGSSVSRYRQYYGTNSYLTLYDWVSLHAILQDYYQITVMMTYRRYYDWLPSVKQQIERWMARKPVMNRWPKYDDPINATDILMSNIMIMNHTTSNIDYLESNIIENSRVVEATKFKGRDIVPIFPNWWKSNLPPGTTADLHAYYLDLIIPGIDQVNHQHGGSTMFDSSRALSWLPTSSSSSPLIHIAIVNMHALLPPLSNEEYNTTTESSLPTSSSSTVRSLFFCALPGATNLCRYSQELDQEKVRSGNKIEVRKNPKKSTWYDELVINAARYGFINITKYAPLRHDIVLLTEKYHKSLLLSNSKSSSSVTYKSNTTQNYNSLNVGGSVNKVGYDNKLGTSNDNYEFPLLCPSVDELTEFLNQSLFFEEQILPDFYHDEIYGKNDHIRRFWDAVHVKNKESYCSIDIISILQQPHWQHFFINMLPNKLRKKMKRKNTIKNKKKKKKKKNHS